MKSVSAIALAIGLLAFAPDGLAQQSVDYASVSGRVTDPSGAVVTGARVAARHTQTNVIGTTATDEAGRFRLPYLRVGPHEITVSQPGFATATRVLTLTAGAAFELPVTLSVGALDTSVTVTGEATVLEAARSQIAGDRLAGRGPERAAERPQLPRPRAAHPGRLADQHRQHAALPRDLRRAGRRASRSAASATSRTTSSSTACRPTTTRPA